MESEARVRADLARLRSVLSLPPPAASGPCLGALALVGVRGGPLCFAPVFPLFSWALLEVTLCRTALARAAVGTHFGSSHCGSIVQLFARVLQDRLQARCWKTTTHWTATALHSATPNSNKSLGVVAERVLLRPAEKSNDHGDDEGANRSHDGENPTPEK